VDVFPAAGPNPGPVHVFFHGGYWKMNHKHEFGFVANPFVASGAAVVVVEYALIPTVDMAELVRQSRAAMAWVWRNAASFGGDAGRIHVSGHSAGGHLTAMMMATDWPAFEPGLPADLVKTGCAISGIYDLEPIRLCFMNEELHFTPEQVASYSPVLLEPRGGGTLLLPVGAMEGNEFIRQSEDLAAAWSAKGIDARAWIMPGHHHFSIINQYIDANSELSVAARRQMGL
jgi:arylformamidase